MPYIPHTEEDRREMLQTIGVDSIDDLFREIPESLRLREQLNLPPALDEHRLLAHLFGIAGKNTNLLSDAVCFLGAGIYDRYIPATVGAVISRGEFLTAYTPYQPELSQGYLQTIYEFQSMVAELYGMDLANASMYDGATSMAEAAILAYGVNGRKRVVVSEAVHPHYRQVLETYCWSMDLEVAVAPHREGLTSADKLDSETACLIVQYPNFFGVIEDLRAARRAADAVGAMLIVVADPIAMGLLPPPGQLGADIVVGEGQPLGIAMGFGGPMLGLFACNKDLVRRIPGRIVGRTTDHDGNPGFVMTLRTREQDIRREKATSNICTNEALMALAATVYMSALGKNGIRSVAESTVRGTQYAMRRLAEAGGRVRFGDRRVFGEFVLELPRDAAIVQRELLDQGILAGLPLGPYYAGMENCLLVAVTELRTKAQIDDYAQRLRAALA
ncbi:MAG TPA: aminomethyl-transferring glycine dehydrogenase subunit GcvPA [Fimbriimonadaceae bacterium]|nr:aminomethyl-transferring glycine dehydrogenase subunit GcvPA [Fimbriimonadaceae bacterium]